MNRRKFAQSSLGVAGAASTSLIPSALFAQTPENSATPSSSPVATPGVWTSADDPVTVEYDHEVFGDAETSGVTGEWCVLRIPDIDRFLSIIIKLEEKFPHQPEAMKDYIENDPELNYEGRDAEITRLSVVEDNDAVGVLYQVGLAEAPDTWAFTQFIPVDSLEERTIQVWVASRRSKLDREFMEAAVTSVLINGEPAVRAMDVSELFDQVEALEA